MHFKGKTVFITGASGFVGSNLTRYLCSQGAEVHIALRRDSDLWRISDLKGKIHHHFLDITITKELRKIFLEIKPKYIFHLASYGAYSWQEDIDLMIKTNIKGTLSVLEASSRVDYECFINTGSSSEYGFKKTRMKEDMVIVPNSFYALTKASATHLCSVWANKYKKPIVTFRLFSVYGPYEDKRRLIPTAMKAAILKKTLSLTPGGEMRDFIYIKDVIAAFETAVRHKDLRGDIFNIGTAQQYSNKEIATVISKISETGLGFKLGTYKSRVWDTDYWVADNSKAKKVLGWAPSYELSQGLEETYLWFRENLHYYS